MKKRFFSVLAFALGMGFAINASALSVEDVTMDDQEANGYAGIFEGNIENYPTKENPAAPGVFNDTNYWTDADGVLFTASGDEFELIAKWETEYNEGEEYSFSIEDLEFTLSYTGTYVNEEEAGVDAYKSGDWTLSWDGVDIPNDEFLSYTLDFVVGLKTAQGHAFYLFQDYIMSLSPSSVDGEYVTFNGKDLSHMNIYARITEKTAVPEPGTMLLFGTGLAGLAAVGRRRKN